MVKLSLDIFNKLFKTKKESEEDKLIRKIREIGYYVAVDERGYKFVLGGPRKYVLVLSYEYLVNLHGVTPDELWRVDVKYDGFVVSLVLYDFDGKLVLYVDYPIDVFSKLPLVMRLYKELQHIIPVEVKVNPFEYYAYVRKLISELVEDQTLAEILASLYKIFIIEPYKMLDPLIHAPAIQEVNTFAIIKPGTVPGSCEHIVQITHAKYGPVDTNLILSEEHLQDLVIIIARDCGKSISRANPRTDVVDKYGNRINLELFSIEANLASRIALRVHPHEFLPPPLYFAEMNPCPSTNLPYILNAFTQYKMIGCIFGGMGSGKTTFMTVAMSLYDPQTRIGMVSDIPEMFMQIPHPYKHVSLVRSVQEYQYVIAAMLRANLDVVTIGEIRTAIEYKEFINASSTHGGLTTIHANTEETLYSRLNSFERELNIYPPFPPFRIVTGISRAIAFERGRRVVIRYIRGVHYVEKWLPELKLVPIVTFDPEKRVHVIHEDGLKLYLNEVAESSGVYIKDLEELLKTLDEAITGLAAAWKVDPEFRKQISDPDRWLDILRMLYGSEDTRKELLSKLEKYTKLVETKVEVPEIERVIVSERVTTCPLCGSRIVDEKRTDQGIVLICEKGHEILYRPSPT